MKISRKKLIHKFLDKSLTDKELEFFIKEISNDPEYAKEVKQYAEILVFLKSAGTYQAGIRRRIYKAILVAASIAALVGVGFYTGYKIYNTRMDYLSGTKQSSNTMFDISTYDSSTVETENRMEQIPEKEQNIKADENKYFLLAQNFQQNPTIEQFIKSNFRDIDRNISIIAPNDSACFQPSQPILFALKGMDDDITVYYEVYDNKFSKVTELKSSGGYSTFEKNLNPGLYYWKYKYGNTEVWAGKFYILPYQK